MKIVGICGEIGSGKSTFAEFLTQADAMHSIHLETSQVIIELGDIFNASLRGENVPLLSPRHYQTINHGPVRAMLPAISRMAGRQILPQELDIDPQDAERHPEWYEKLDVYLTAVQDSPELLALPITKENKNTYRPLLQWLGGYVLYRTGNNLLWYQELIRRIDTAGPDIRLAALTALKQPEEAEYIRSQGGRIIRVVRPGLQTDTTDVTELRASQITPDTEVINDGGLVELAAVATTVHADLSAGGLRPIYRART